MIKVTEKGIEDSGERNKLSEEDLDFIGEMFKDYTNYEKHPLDKRDDYYND
jgi:hypothetical protein